MKNILLFVLTIVVTPVFGITIEHSTAKDKCEWITVCMLRTEKSREALFKRLITDNKKVLNFLYRGYRLKETQIVPTLPEDSECLKYEGNPFFSTPRVFLFCPTKEAQHKGLYGRSL